jgi:hypothetical protein
VGVPLVAQAAHDQRENSSEAQLQGLGREDRSCVILFVVEMTEEAFPDSQACHDRWMMSFDALNVLLRAAAPRLRYTVAGNSSNKEDLMVFVVGRCTKEQHLKDGK